MRNGPNKNGGEVLHKTLMHRVAAVPGRAALRRGLLVDEVGIAQVTAAGPFANVKLDHDLQQIF